MSQIKVILAYVPVILDVNLSGWSSRKYSHVFCVCVLIPTPFFQGYMEPVTLRRVWDRQLHPHSSGPLEEWLQLSCVVKVTRLCLSVDTTKVVMGL
jgi:hypothetical protein